MGKKKWVILLAALLLILAGSGSKAGAEDMGTAAESENVMNNTTNSAGTLVTAVIEVPENPGGDSGGETGGDSGGNSGGETGGDPSRNPYTGDAARTGFYRVMLVISAGALCVLVRTALKNRADDSGTP